MNPISTLLLVPLISFPQVLGILFWDNFAAAVWCTVGISLIFILTYLLGINIAKNGRAKNK